MIALWGSTGPTCSRFGCDGPRVHQVVGGPLASTAKYCPTCARALGGGGGRFFPPALPTLAPVIPLHAAYHTDT